MPDRAQQAADKLAQLAGSTPDEYAAALNEFNAKDIGGALAWYGGPVARAARVVLGPDELHGLAAQPVELAAAPGAGFMLLLLAYAFELAAGDPYEGYVGIRHDGGSTDLTDFRPPMSAADDSVTTGYLSGVTLPRAEVEDRALVLVATQDLGATGSGSLAVVAIYTTVQLI